MKINIEELAHKLFIENLKLRGHLIVLEQLVEVIIEKFHPDYSKHLLSKYHEMKNESYSQMLLDDPFLDQAWKEFFSELPFDGNQEKPFDKPQDTP